jgi:hypothetical protein
MKVLLTTLCTLILIIGVLFSGCVSSDARDKTQITPPNVSQNSSNVSDSHPSIPFATEKPKDLKENNLKSCGDITYDSTKQSCCNGLVVIEKPNSCVPILEDPDTYNCSSLKEEMVGPYILNYCKKNDGTIHGYRLLSLTPGSSGAQVVAGILLDAINISTKEYTNIPPLDRMRISFPQMLSNGMVDVPIAGSSYFAQNSCDGHVNVSKYQPIDRWIIESVNLNYKSNEGNISIRGDDITIIPSFINNREIEFVSQLEAGCSYIILIPDYQITFNNIEVNDNGKISSKNNITIDLETPNEFLDAVDKSTGDLYISDEISSVANCKHFGKYSV